jgi:ankyrin repeat protein
VADAAMKGDRESLRALLVAKADVNAPQVDGATALHWAIYRDDLETADLLIRAGANVRTANREGVTPLAMATLYANASMVKKLLSAGADARESGPNGESVLMLAARSGNPEIIGMLLAGGADVNAKEKLRGNLANKHGWTPLYLATDNRNIEGGDYPTPKPDIDHLEYIRFLLDHGANPNARVADGAPKSHSTLTRTIFTMQWFFEEGATAFVRAAQSGDVALLRLLLSHGADPRIPTSFGDTALSAAAGIGWVEGVTQEQSPRESFEAVKLLLDLGLDPNSVNGDSRTPLMGAAHKGRTDVIQLLMDRGAKLETRDKGSRDTHLVDLSFHGGWQALDYADGLVRVGVQSALAHPEASELIRHMMVRAGLETPPLDRTLGYVCAVQGPLCKDAEP